MNSWKKEIYSLMEKFKFNPSNGNRYYEGVIKIVDTRLKAQKKSILDGIEGKMIKEPNQGETKSGQLVNNSHNQALKEVKKLVENMK